MTTGSSVPVEARPRALFADRARLEANIAQLLSEFSRNHPTIAGLNLSLYRRVGDATAAEEYGVEVRPCT